MLISVVFVLKNQNFYDFGRNISQAVPTYFQNENMHSCGYEFTGLAKIFPAKKLYSPEVEESSKVDNFPQKHLYGASGAPPSTKAALIGDNARNQQKVRLLLPR